MEKLIPTKTGKPWNSLYSLTDDEHNVTEGGGVLSVWVAKGGERENMCLS